MKAPYLHVPMPPCVHAPMSPCCIPSRASYEASRASYEASRASHDHEAPRIRCGHCHCVYSLYRTVESAAPAHRCCPLQYTSCGCCVDHASVHALQCEQGVIVGEVSLEVASGQGRRSEWRGGMAARGYRAREHGGPEACGYRGMGA